MGNKITVSICGEEYTFTAEESSSYMQKVAALVDAKMEEILSASHYSMMDAAILSAVNIADEYLKLQGSGENLRSQLKSYLDEANAAKAEVSELKREVFRLQQEITKLKAGK